MAKRVKADDAKAKSSETPQSQLQEYMHMEQLRSRRSSDRLLRLLPAKKRLDQLVLEPSVLGMARTVIEERRATQKLSGAGLAATSVVGLFGPSGWGKTSLAAAIADALGQPCFAVRHGAVISSYLGDTADNLERLVEGVQGAPMVLLIDEFDSFAQSRKRDDIGEMRRVCNSLLQMMEALPPNVLLIVCSNLADYLDSAIWRRLQTVIQVGPRDLDFYTETWSQQVRDVFLAALQGRVRDTETIEGWTREVLLSEKSSPADAERIGLAMARYVTIHGDKYLLEDLASAWRLVMDAEYWRRRFTNPA